VITPGNAAGSTTLLIVSHWLTPSAALASRYSSGTLLSASRLVMSTSGRSMNPSTTMPTNREFVLPNRGTRNARPKSPKTMLGVLQRPLVVTSTRLVKRPCSAYSVRNTAAPTPNGTAKSIAPITSHAVPAIAGSTPGTST
jgi:hypothetical protein